MLLSLYKNIAFLVVTLGNYRFFLPFFRLFKGRYPHLPKAETQLCVEGFPRSGNTFFVAALARWNRGLNIAHHSHLAGSAKVAVQAAVPCVVLIRPPKDAVASAMVWDGKVKAWIGLLAYISFYRSLQSRREKLVVLHFDDVVTQPKSCVDQLNHRFGLALNGRELTPGEADKIRDVLARGDKRNKRSELNSALPNETKTNSKAVHEHNIVNSRLYGAAQRAYHAFLSEQIQ